MELPNYSDLKKALPLYLSQKNFIEQSQKTVKRILNSTDDRLLIIVGPCSIHDLSAAKEFAIFLKELSHQVEQSCFLVMRTYFEKPRTALGWKGFIYDPYLDSSSKVAEGIVYMRQFLLELASLNVPVATEFVDPFLAPYYDDLISWGSIGARTSSSQIHRQLASSLSMAVGFKNAVSGHLSSAIDGALFASYPHNYVGLSQDGTLSTLCSNGNIDAHIVLRGGETSPNYNPASIQQALQQLKLAGLPGRLIVDASHHNSRKEANQQMEVFQAIMEQIVNGTSQIRGIMLESNLYFGSQQISALSDLKYGVSITDSCLDLKRTKS